jgi:hypothetical protein
MHTALHETEVKLYVKLSGAEISDNMYICVC